MERVCEDDSAINYSDYLMCLDILIEYKSSNDDLFYYDNETGIDYGFSFFGAFLVADYLGDKEIANACAYLFCLEMCPVLVEKEMEESRKTVRKNHCQYENLFLMYEVTKVNSKYQNVFSEYLSRTYDIKSRNTYHTRFNYFFESYSVDSMKQALEFLIPRINFKRLHEYISGWIKFRNKRDIQNFVELLEIEKFDVKRTDREKLLLIMRKFLTSSEFKKCSSRWIQVTDENLENAIEIDNEDLHAMSLNLWYQDRFNYRIRKQFDISRVSINSRKTRVSP